MLAPQNAQHTASRIAELPVYKILKCRRLVLVSIGAIMNHPREWFQPKVVGIGWTPRTWEGWAITVSVIAVGALVGRVNL
jgi:hypothetical protein